MERPCQAINRNGRTCGIKTNITCEFGGKGTYYPRWVLVWLCKKHSRWNEKTFGPKGQYTAHSCTESK